MLKERCQQHTQRDSRFLGLSCKKEKLLLLSPHPSPDRNNLFGKFIRSFNFYGARSCSYMRFSESRCLLHTAKSYFGSGLFFVYRLRDELNQRSEHIDFLNFHQFGFSPTIRPRSSHVDKSILWLCLLDS